MRFTAQKYSVFWAGSQPSEGRKRTSQRPAQMGVRTSGFRALLSRFEIASRQRFSDLTGAARATRLVRDSIQLQRTESRRAR